MKNFVCKVVFSFFCLILLSILTSDIFGQNSAENNSDKKSVAQKKAEDERRKEVESLMLQGKYQHDGSGELLYIGTIESVPALLKVLEDNPGSESSYDFDNVQVVKKGENQTSSKTPKPEQKPQKLYICTYFHAVQALRKITGQNYIEYEDWKNWWENYQKEKK